MGILLITSTKGGKKRLALMPNLCRVPRLFLFEKKEAEALLRRVEDITI